MFRGSTLVSHTFADRGTFVFSVRYHLEYPIFLVVGPCVLFDPVTNRLFASCILKEAFWCSAN